MTTNVEIGSQMLPEVEPDLAGATRFAGAAAESELDVRRVGTSVVARV